MPKIVLVGAGSVEFSRNLIGDLLTFPSLRDSTLALVDIDEERLSAIAALGRRMAAQEKANVRIESSVDRRRVLEGADYVIMSIRVGDVEGAVARYRIPHTYGVDQAVGDTVGPGGVFQFLVNGPAVLDILMDVERMAPRAWVMQYTNPMGMSCLLAHMATRTRHVGLCHSVQGIPARLAGYIGVPRDEVRCWVAGINHMAWVLRFEWKGKDAYPLLREAMARPEIYARDPVRFEVMRHFGYFVTESSGHMSEYVPYFRRTPELIRQYGLSSADGLEERAARWAARRRAQREEIRRLAQSDEPIPIERTREYCGFIIDAIERDQPFAFNGNVRNTGLIPNLPHDCVVEVLCVAQGTGIHPCHVGDLPAELAALNRSNLAVQELAVRGLLNRDREAVHRAVQLDPLTSSVLALPRIRQMVDEMFAAFAPDLVFQTSKEPKP